MFLQRALEPHYPAALRAEGERLVAERRVYLVLGDRWSVSAETHGELGEVQETYLDRIRGGLRVECTCPQFDELTACAHVWAAAVLAGRQGYLTGYGGIARVHLLNLPTIDPGWAPAAGPSWKAQLQSLAKLGSLVPAEAPVVREKSIFYCLQPSYSERGFRLTVAASERKVNGEWSKLRDSLLTPADLPHLPAADQEILGLLNGNRSLPDSTRSGLVAAADISGRFLEHLLRTAEDGQLLWGSAREAEEAAPVNFDAAAPWRLALEFQGEGEEWAVNGLLRRPGPEGEEQLPLASVRALTSDGFLVGPHTIARVETGAALAWARALRTQGGMRVPRTQELEFVRELIEQVPAAQVAWPAELPVEEVQVPMVPRLRFRTPQAQAAIRGVLSFTYGEEVFDEAGASGRGVRAVGPLRFVVRDLAAESAARAALKTLGLKPVRLPNEVTPLWEISARRFPAAVIELVRQGWTVESEGRLMRPSTGFKVEVSSGIDWFGLKGKVEFGGQSVALPELIENLRRGTTLIRLGDGSFGMLPEDLLKRYGVLLEVGAGQGEELRFTKAQASLLDAYLAELPEVSTDELFEQARRELREFQGVQPRQEPPGFQGTLRDYQRAGLGWLDFLRRCGFGGCLADDMGVGKTPQVLAHLESIRGNGASLVVVPRSLIHNWRQEAARFTPALRVLDYSDPTRTTASFQDCDLVLTTYGILRRDIAALREVEFEYVILDEAQAIKNAASESAKAARLLRARHRLALSGTPIENHLGELWSLFEFLNPGMLGASRFFQALAANTPAADDTRERVAQAIKPFLLRRTKGQVARELPERLEQTIYCELDGGQRKLYEELRQHYRAKLLKTPSARTGLAKGAKIQVLEALLRLRQAASHPALIDPEKYAGHSSAKLETLMENLEQVREEGHKALVFSQFTSMLALVRKALEERGLDYAYLDGQTKDRQAVVEKFQSDEGPGIFLISLKAGGVGLNLTAAEYVFLLDPWWNPAAEAQAIDRAHRIGQARTVFAYRLIAQGTVEEHVLELQQGKRELADAILGEDQRLIGNLTPEDLELLLS